VTASRRYAAIEIGGGRTAHGISHESANSPLINRRPSPFFLLRPSQSPPIQMGNTGGIYLFLFSREGDVKSLEQVADTEMETVANEIL